MSKGSKKSGVAKPSYVDESLFGKHHSVSENIQHPPVDMPLSNSSLGVLASSLTANLTVILFLSDY